MVKNYSCPIQAVIVKSLCSKKGNEQNWGIWKGDLELELM